MQFAFLATIGSERVKQPHPKGIFPVILFLLFPSVDAHSLVPKKLSHSLFSNCPYYTLFAPQILHKPLFLNAPGSIAFSQEHFKTISYAKFGGQTECIMGNWKIVNLLCFLSVDAHKEPCPRGIFPVVPGES